MSFLKISDLPAATSAGATDQLETNQGGTSRRLTVEQVAAYVSGNLASPTITGPTVVGVNSTSDALRITQTGSGNALLVEDSANPDATPFVVNNVGSVGIGILVPESSLHLNGQFTLDRNETTATSQSQQINQRRKRQSDAILASGDRISSIFSSGWDGASYILATAIYGEVDGTPGTSDMPGRLVFATTADGASSPTERMRIDSNGSVGIGVVGQAQNTLRVGRNITGAIFSAGIVSDGQVQSSVTSRADYFLCAIACAAGTYGNINGYQAQQSTFSGTVTNQNGFRADASLTGATNNSGFTAENTAAVTAGRTAYGFLSNVNTATGGGTTFGFYANGTAPNYFNGNVGIGTTNPTARLNVVDATSQDAVRITQTGTGNALVVEDSANPDATPFVVNADGNVLVGHTASINDIFGNSICQIRRPNGNLVSYSNYANDAFAGISYFNKARGGSIASPTAVSSGDAIAAFVFAGYDGASFVQAANITAAVDGTPGTNDMPGRLVFSTTADGASTPTERVRITADGNVGIGTSAPAALLNVVANTASDAVRITQTGAGNALVVEDSANPDSTPFVVNADGRVLVGLTAAIPVAGATAGFQIAAVAGFIDSLRYSADAFPPLLKFVKSRSATVGTNTAVQSGDQLGQVGFLGADGASYIFGAAITGEVDGTPGTNDMPGRLVFLTTPDGSNTPTERMRITNAGNVGIGTSAPVNRLQVNGSFGRGAPVTKTGNFTLADTENWIICNGAGSITVTFPAASSWTGREVMIKTIAAQTVVSASSNVVPLAGGAAGTAILAASAGAWATLVSDGTNWIIMQA